MLEPPAKPQTWQELALEISNEKDLSKAVQLASDLLYVLGKEDSEKRTGVAQQ